MDKDIERFILYFVFSGLGVLIWIAVIMVLGFSIDTWRETIKRWRGE